MGGDTVIEPLLEEIRTTKGQERKAKLEQLGTELRHEEKHVPFNHELEQLHIELRVCTETGSGLKCEMEASEELVVHDAAVLGGSAQKTMLDQLGNGDRCSYGCEKSPNTDVPFSQLEGAFMRFASGPADKDNFKGVETFAYMDIDVSMAKANSKGAIMAVLFLENPQDHPLPVEKREFVEKGREDALAQVGQRWQIGFLADPIRSSNSYTLHNSYGQVGHQVFGNKEISDAHRLAHADSLTKLSTGHPETVGGQAPVILDALEQQQVNAFEGERHNSDSSDASTAKHMSEEHFYQHMSYTFPSGHP